PDMRSSWACLRRHFSTRSSKNSWSPTYETRETQRRCCYRAYDSAPLYAGRIFLHRLDALMKPDPEELPQELREITSDVTSIPGTLYFTPEVFDQLNELCVLKRITPTRLIVEAINSQGARWEEFI